jgi:Holliday junction resolvase
MGKMQRTKGAKAEREFAEILNKKFGAKYKRTPLSGGMDLKGDIRRSYGSKHTIVDDFHWEIKRQETISIHKWYNQAKSDAPSLMMPVVAFRRNNDEWKVTLSAEDFLNVIKELEDLRRT